MSTCEMFAPLIKTSSLTDLNGLTIYSHSRIFLYINDLLYMLFKMNDCNHLYVRPFVPFSNEYATIIDKRIKKSKKFIFRKHARENK